MMQAILRNGPQLAEHQNWMIRRLANALAVRAEILPLDEKIAHDADASTLATVTLRANR